MRTLVETADEEGVALALYRRDAAWEVTVDGRTILATDGQGAQRGLAELALGMWRGRDDISVLVGGLGSGAAVRAALDQPGVCRVDVVEVSEAIIRWEAHRFGGGNGGATADPRAHVHHGELTAFLRAPRIPDLPADGWFAILLDVDEWPTWVARPGNRLLYSDEGIALLESAMRPGGVLGVWTTEKDEELTRRMNRRLQSVSRVAVPAGDHLYYVLRGRRGPRRSN